MLRAIHLSLLLLCGFALSAQTLPARRVYFIGNRCLVTDSLGATSADYAASQVSVNFYPGLPKPSVRLRTPDESGYLLPTQFLKADGTVYGSTVSAAFNAWNYAVASATGGIGGGGGSGGSVTWDAITGKPVLFSGAYGDLSGKPALSTVAGSGSYLDLINRPALFSGSYLDLTNRPSLFSGAYADLTGKPALFSGSYLDLTNRPTLFSGAYGDLTGKPVIPSATVVDNNLTGTDATHALSSPAGKVLADSNNAQRTDINAARTIAQNALNSAGLKAPIASPTFTGTPTAPTALSTNNSTQIATTSFVNTVLRGYMRDSLQMFVDSTQFQYTTTKGLQIKPGVLGASGNASGWVTSGSVTSVTGSVGIGTTTPNKMLHVAGSAQFDAIYLTGANSAETNSAVIRRLSGVGVQIGGFTLNDNPEMSTQGNANMTWGGNLFMKVGGKAWFWHTNGYLSINNDTTTPTAYFDVNNGAGYDGLRLRNTYTPTSSSDANGQVGSLAWDASYIYVKTASGWKRSALSTF